MILFFLFKKKIYRFFISLNDPSRSSIVRFFLSDFTKNYRYWYCILPVKKTIIQIWIPLCFVEHGVFCFNQSTTTDWVMGLFTQISHLLEHSRIPECLSAYLELFTLIVFILQTYTLVTVKFWSITPPEIYLL